MSKNSADFENYILHQFDAQFLNRTPETELDFFKMYARHSDFLFSYIDLLIDDECIKYPLINEMRSMLGHICAYRIQCDTTKRDLDKAYGHLRRFTVDCFKRVCNEFDKTLSRELRRQCRYDFREECNGYLREYGEKYFSARNKYLDAQLSEKSGSNLNHENIIAKYHEAAKEYIELKQYYESLKKQIHWIRFKVIVRSVGFAVVTLVSIIVTIAGLVKDSEALISILRRFCPIV